MADKKTETVGVIDLGSNTARLIVLQSAPGYAYRLIDEIREVVRLRLGMTESGLNEKAVARAFSTLRLFTRFCESIEVDHLVAMATSAVRQATNGPAFVSRVEEEIGLKLEILSGDREAYYGVLGALNEISLDQGYVVDIGGGSAQVSLVLEGKFQRGTALPLGTITLSERFVRRDPPSKKDLAALQAEIQDQLESLDWLQKSKNRPLVGLGGTIRNLAKIEAARQEHPLLTLHGLVLTRESIEASIEEFLSTSPKKRRAIRGLKPDRADIILPGALVILSIMEHLDKEQLLLSTSGIREGAFLERFWQHLPYPVMPEVRSFSVLNLARNYRYDKKHANHVRYLCGRIFDQLKPLHGFGPEDRALLEAAALLHDIGSIIGYDGHHKHSQALIETNGLAGYSPREIALIALLTRNHRKGSPSIKGYERLLGGADLRWLTQLAAILRLAEYLERGRTGTIDDAIMTWNEEHLRITLIADEYPYVEVWQSEQNAFELLEEAFHRRVLMDSSTAPKGSISTKKGQSEKQTGLF